MKKVFFVLFFLLLTLSSFSQNNKPNTEEYLEFTSYGSYDQDQKHGLWVDKNQFGTIYRIGEYDHGIPIGVWKVNYPNGSPRKITTYNNNGDIIKWVMLEKYNTISIEIVADSIISPFLISSLASIEELLYENPKASISILSNNKKHYVVYVRDIEYLKTFFHAFSFSGKCIYYDNGKNNLIDAENFFKNGILTGKKYYYYKKGKIKKIYVYEGDQLKTKIFYDQTGNVINTIQYPETNTEKPTKQDNVKPQDKSGINDDPIYQ